MNRESDFLERLRTKIEETSLIDSGDRVIVALSGGADSVALLCALVDLGYNVCAYHLNHSLRGDAADGDESFCRELCRSREVQFFSEKIDVSEYARILGVSFEDAGRRARYEGLAEVVSILGSAGSGTEASVGRLLVATGHHAGDVAETFFMNVLRGAGLSGLCSIADEADRAVQLNAPECGFSNSDSHVTLRIVRPLIDFRKSELTEYLRGAGISWREDATNDSDEYFRNRIRRLLNDVYIQKIADCVQLLKKDRDFLDAHAERLASKLITENTVQGYRTVFLKLGSEIEAMQPASGNKSDNKYCAPKLYDAEFSRLVRISVKRLRGDIVDLSRRDVEAVMALGRVGARVNIAGNVEVYRSYDTLEFSMKSEGAQTAKRAFSDFATRSSRCIESVECCDGLIHTGGAQLKSKAAGLPDNRENPVNSVCVEYITREEYAQRKNAAYALGGVGQKRGREYSIVIDMSKVVGNLRIRRRMEGDTLVPLGMSGHRSLKKLLIDEKIDRRQRDDIPIVVDDEKIVWVAGVRMSELVKVDAASLSGSAKLAMLTLIR